MAMVVIGSDREPGTQVFAKWGGVDGSLILCDSKLSKGRDNGLDVKRSNKETPTPPLIPVVQGMLEVEIVTTWEGGGGGSSAFREEPGYS